MSAPLDPHVSAVIPVRGRAALLRRCLTSLMAQDRPPDAIIVVEDGVEDGIGDGGRALTEVVAAFERARLLRLPRWSGAAAARNAGVAASPEGGAPGSGLIWFLDSDSVADDPGALAAAVALMARLPDVGAVGAEVVRHDGGPRQVQIKHLQPNGSAHTALLAPEDVRELACDYLPTCACLVRRSAFFRVGGFDPAWRFLSEDTDLCAKLWRWGWRVLADGRCGVLHDQGHGQGQGDLDLMLRNELRFALLHLPARATPALPLHQLRFALDPRTRARLASGAPGVMKHLGSVPEVTEAAERSPLSLARVGGRYALGLARAWGWSGLRAREILAARRALDAAAPLPARFPLRADET